MLAPIPFPKRKPIHSAPVSTLDRRSHDDKYIIRKIWLNTGHNHGIHTLFNPYTNSRVTIHMVPEMSNIPEALDNPSIDPWKRVAAKKITFIFCDACFFSTNPIVYHHQQINRIMLISRPDKFIREQCFFVNVHILNIRFEKGFRILIEANKIFRSGVSFIRNIVVVSPTISPEQNIAELNNMDRDLMTFSRKPEKNLFRNFLLTCFG